MLSESGTTIEMLDAKYGYMLWEKKVNDQGGFEIGKNKQKVNIEFISLDDASDAVKHYNQVRRLKDEFKVDSSLAAIPATQPTRPPQRLRMDS